jgi:hypothetical protein
VRSKLHHRSTCAIEVDPPEVDAGAELTVTIRASCPHGCDLSRQRVSIRNADDAELAGAELAERNADSHEARMALRALLEARERACRAVLAAHETNGVLHEATTAEFRFTVKAHAMSVHVWDVPYATAAGERFSLKVGVKCSAGCDLTGRQLSIFDHGGGQVAVGSLDADVWPGTNALYFAELEVQAPLRTGDHQWRIEIPTADTGVPHAPGSSGFTVKVVAAPDHEVTVEAFDRDGRTPVEGAHVLMHPYRAFTDANGVAKLKVGKGSYRLFVSGFNYIAFQDRIHVAADMTVRAELAAEPEGQEDYGY